jgi:hypothetical protein
MSTSEGKPPLDLPPVDPGALDRAARRFINTPPPPKGWKPPKVEKGKKEGDGK